MAEKDQAERPKTDKMVQDIKLLVEQMTTLAKEDRQSLGKLFDRFHQLQKKWDAFPASMISSEQQQDYTDAVQVFYQKIRLHKELKEVEWKKNLEKKEELIEKLRQLLASPLADADLDQAFRACKKSWNNIGATYVESWERLKPIYQDLEKQFEDKLKDFRANNLQLLDKEVQTKKEIIALVGKLTESFPTNKQKLADLTKTFLRVEQHWKNLGFLEHPEDEVLNRQFKALYLSFFKYRRSFYRDLMKDYKANEIQKKEVLKEIEDFVTQEVKDWDQATKAFEKLHKKFTKIPSSGNRSDNALWENLKKIGDTFYDARRAYRSLSDQEEEKNLAEKKQILAELQNYQLTEDAEHDINQLEDMAKNFGAIPSKNKVVQAQFKNLLDEKCQALSILDEQKDKIRFNLKITAVKGNEDPESAINKERELYVKELQKITAELAKFENNLGFFGKNARAIESLFKETNEKLEQLKKRAEFLKEQIRILEKTKKEIS